MTLFWLMLIPVLLLLGCQSKIIYYPQPYHEGNRRTLEKHGGVVLAYETGQGRQVAHYVPTAYGGGGSGREAGGVGGSVHDDDGDGAAGAGLATVLSQFTPLR
ncbi:MAG: hypothetical protein NTV80_15950 [Verrucomicrobia bacterium]|nr:hypothetical protein [Verrucomicrobiota bacterium]